MVAFSHLWWFLYPPKPLLQAYETHIKQKHTPKNHICITKVKYYHRNPQDLRYGCHCIKITPLANFTRETIID